MPGAAGRRHLVSRAKLLAALLFWVVRVKSAGARRRLLDQNCPATYPVSFAGTCYLCPQDHPYFLSRKCYTDQVSASAASANTANAVQATSQPITDPPTSEEVVTSVTPAAQGTVSNLLGGTVVTYSCADASQILWNNNCYTCPGDHPYFNGGNCYNANPTVSATNPNSASAAAARQQRAGNDPNPGGGGLIKGGRRLLEAERS